MEVTHAQSVRDLEEIADLKGKIFKRATYYEFYEERMRFQTRDPWFLPEHAFIVRDGGRIVSHVSLFVRPLRFGPAILQTAGIGDVLTIPEYRGKGLSNLLMQAALNYMKNNKFDLTMLFGIPNYYHKFGYIESMNYYQLEVFNSGPDLPDTQFSAREFSAGDLPPMLELYRTNTRASHLVVDRTVPYFESKAIDPNQVVVLTDSARRLAGYAFTWDAIKSQFTVIEAISTHRAASLALFSEILKRKPAGESTLKIKMSPQMPFVRHVRYLGTDLQSRCFGEGEGKGMLALVDLCQVLQKFKPLFDQRLAASRWYDFSGRLEIHSQQSVELVFEDGCLSQCQKIVPPAERSAGLVTDLRYFTRNVIGYWSIPDLLDQTGASVSDDDSRELLETLFPKLHPFLLPFDYF